MFILSCKMSITINTEENMDIQSKMGKADVSSDATSNSITHAKEYLHGLMTNLEDIRLNAGGTRYETQTFHHDGEDHGENICVLKNYKQIQNIAVAGDIRVFGDNALTAIDEGEEFNSPDIGSALVVRGLESFVVGNQFSRAAIIQAKNVYIKSLNYGNFCILADTVFLGKDVGFDAAYQGKGLIVCRKRFVYPFDGERQGVPFEQDDETLQQIMERQDHRSVVESIEQARDVARQKGKSNLTLEAISVVSRLASFWSTILQSRHCCGDAISPLNAIMSTFGKKILSSIQVSTANKICLNSADFNYSTDSSQPLYDVLFEFFMRWCETKKIFPIL